ncbi:hypothetical protein ABL78_4376 [Leptomonas seymouri]|uniref:Uncharacterized protein n=1 Tax=Leptomonas seymouri TaxID=5684 RepID=A0A0N1IKA8_LEPSE|nr:hypothetical protein ABL78_4376 [Leptomonas seymouri]|eukprot:KPI86553.1 hypothetical protein ABL78_4376 [Leptomonas seymouri]
MGRMEEYVTDTSLSQTLCNTAYPNLVLRCVVVDTVPLRRGEFSDERVFTAIGSISPPSPNHAGSCKKLIRINFYGLWGMAAAFMDPGDVIILHGFYRLDAPSRRETAGKPPSSTSSIFLCPLREQEGCVMRVLQPAKTGEVMEVLVTPSNMDAICVHGLPTSDTANHFYMRQCLTSASVQQ